MMNDFFKWWYTNDEGNEYMTLLGCSLNDLWVVGITIILCTWIVWQYARIAIDAYIQSRSYETSITKKYLLSKVNVFVFCAITGYGYTILSVFVNPYKFRIILLLILGVWAYKFRKSIKRTNVLKRIFESEKMIQEKLSKAKKMQSAFSSNREGSIITYEELLNTQYNIWIELPAKGVRFMRTYNTKKPVFFITEMNPEKSNGDFAEFGIHLHDCIEIGKIVKGHMLDEVGGNIYNESDTFKFDSNQEHHPKASIFSIYEVEFIKQ